MTPRKIFALLVECGNYWQYHFVVSVHGMRQNVNAPKKENLSRGYLLC